MIAKSQGSRSEGPWMGGHIHGQQPINELSGLGRYVPSAFLDCIYSTGIYCDVNAGEYWPRFCSKEFAL